MLAEEPVLNERACRVYHVNDGIGVPVISCRKNGHFIIDVRGSETLNQIGTFEHSLLEGPIVAARCFHVDKHVWLILFIDVSKLWKLLLIIVAH